MRIIPKTYVQSLLVRYPTSNIASMGSQERFYYIWPLWGSVQPLEFQPSTWYELFPVAAVLDRFGFTFLD